MSADGDPILDALEELHRVRTDLHLRLIRVEAAIEAIRNVQASPARASRIAKASIAETVPKPSPATAPAESDREQFKCTTCYDGTVVSDTCDTCRERHCPDCDDCEGAAPSKKSSALEELATAARNQGLHSAPERPLSPAALDILRHLKATDGGLRAGRIVQRTGMPVLDARKATIELLRAGRITKRGEKSATRYYAEGL